MLPWWWCFLLFLGAALALLGKRERKERKGGRGVFCLLPSRLVVGLGFGCVLRAWGSVRSDRLPCPCCFSRALPFWFPPLAAVFRLWLMWGFRVPRLLGCWSRQVVLSPFLAVCFFPFVIFYYTTFFWFYTIFFWYFCLFVLHRRVIDCSLVGRGQAPPLLVRVRLLSHWLKHNHSNGCSQAKLEPRKRVYNKLSRCQISIFGFCSLRIHNQNHPQKPKHYTLNSF